MKYTVESYLLQKETIIPWQWIRYFDIETFTPAAVQSGSSWASPCCQQRKTHVLTCCWQQVRQALLWQGRKAVGTALGEPAEYSQNASKILNWLPLALHPLDAKMLDILHLHFNHSRYPPLLTIKLIQCSKIHRMEEHKIPAILSLSCLNYYIYIYIYIT